MNKIYKTRNVFQDALDEDEINILEAYLTKRKTEGYAKSELKVTKGYFKLNI